ncbi:MAG: GNAT family acetyltransferase [Actinomycetes bacterium]
MNRIREALPADQAEVVAVWRECGLVRPPNDPIKGFDSALQNQSSTVFVLEDGERIIGAVIAGFDGYRGWFYHLGVKPEDQSLGNGRALITAAEEWLKIQGAPKINLMVLNTNSKVIGFYEKLGYQVQETSVMGKRL